MIKNTTYRIIDEDQSEDVEAVAVRSFYDRSLREWTAYTVDASGYQVGDAVYAESKVKAERRAQAELAR